MSTAQVSQSSTLRNTAPECVGDDITPASGVNRTAKAPRWDPLTGTLGPPAPRTTACTYTPGEGLLSNTRDNQLNEPPASRTSMTSTGSVNQLGELIARIKSLEMDNSLLRASADNLANEFSRRIDSLEDANALLRTRADNSTDILSRRIESLETANSLLQTRADNLADVVSRGIVALERQNSERNPQRPQVKLTPWRATNTVFLLVLGVYKAAGTYLGQTTGPTTADWIVGVLWALIVYWVEPMVPFYEERCAENDSESEEFTLRWFFAHEVSGALPVVPFSVILLFYAYVTATFKGQSTNKSAKFLV
ncbi:hypothetical protein K438DRAFT_1749340 [Mycena galopus ATCC 62051]|nr:hypothetical protein K438DRAFT_1749340 [Mycena galopus ATCC 62051]